MDRATEPQAVVRAQVVLEEHDLAGDGRFGVVVRRFVVADRYRSHLWLVPLDGPGRPVQLTSGAVRDTSPRVAPDGSAVAFRRTPAPAPGSRAPHAAARRRSGDEAQLLVLPITRRRGYRPGRPWRIGVPRDRGAGEIAWSPDARRLALTIDADPPRFRVGPEPVGDDAPTARRVRRIDWRWDEVGHLDRWAHLFVVEARRGARPRQVTRGDWGASKPAWSPDGRSIAFVADRRPDADLLPRSSIWTVPADAGDDVEPREVLALGGPVDRPAWSPDGHWLAAIGYVAADALDDTSPELVVGPADGSTPPWPVAPDLDRPVGTSNDTDLHGWIAGSRTTPCWVDDGTIVAVVTDRGRATPWRFDVDSATGRPGAVRRALTTHDLSTYSLAATAHPAVPRDRRVTALACVGSRPMELITLPLDGPATPVRRTTMGSRWARRFAWPAMRRFEAPGPGGPIEGWIASPADASGERLPTIVDVHGGPLGGWSPAPSVEVVLLCARGYRVVLPDIRGSTGYGREWIRPQLGDWGGVDAADVHAALDHAVGLGLVDPERVGVLGLSYGGFMVNWLLGTSDRFRAGVSEAGVVNQVSAWAGSDSGVEYNRMALLGAPLDPDGVAKLWRQSPLANVARIRAPLLLLQGEADVRCPPSDSEQLFIALRVLRREVEYVLYPEESHVYQASGRPDRRIDRHRRMLDWFDRHVRGLATSGSD